MVGWVTRAFIAKKRSGDGSTKLTKARSEKTYMIEKTGAALLSGTEPKYLLTSLCYAEQMG
jgi:hypothetical protein